MTTRDQARRRKGATRQTKGLGWEPSRRALVESERASEDYALFASDECRDMYGYWQQRLGAQASYVYFIVARAQPAIKIGFAANPITRLRELQCGNPSALGICSVILGDKATERLLHRHWREALVRGEWFGHGYEGAILALADGIAETQIAEHEKGFDLAYVRDVLPMQVLGR